MFYHIGARNADHTEAYASPIKSFKLCGSGSVYLTDMQGGCWFADAVDIIEDPEIIRSLGMGTIVKIKLKEGAGE